MQRLTDKRQALIARNADRKAKKLKRIVSNTMPHSYPPIIDQRLEAEESKVDEQRLTASTPFISRPDALQYRPPADETAASLALYDD